MKLKINTLLHSKVEFYEQFMGLAVVNIDGADVGGLLFQSVDGKHSYLVNAVSNATGSELQLIDLTGKTPVEPTV